MQIHQNSTPTVTIGIVLYNSRDDIDKCLQSIEKQTFQNFEVVLLDNASPDKSGEWVAQQWSEHRLIKHETNVGFGNAHNIIIHSTKSDYYLPLNPDVTLTPNFIEELVQTIVSETHRDVGQVMGKIYFESTDDESPQIYSVGHGILKDGFAINIGLYQPDRGQYNIERDVFGANAAAPLYRRKMLEAIQYQDGEYFDKDIFLYLEDIDLDYRARLLGWRCIFQPKAIAYHKEGASGGSSVKAIKYSVSGIRYYIIFKHAFLRDLLLYNIPLFMLHLIVMTIINPNHGITTIKYLAHRYHQILAKRRWMASRRQLSRQQLMDWYRWSHENADKSYSYFARFWRGRIAKQED